jgi:hypothetical protein
MFHSLEKFHLYVLGTYDSHKITLVLVQILIDFLLINLMLIDPPNKANAQENTKIFPGLRPETPRLQALRPRPNATPSGRGATPLMLRVSHDYSFLCFPPATVGSLEKLSILGKSSYALLVYI